MYMHIYIACILHMYMYMYMYMHMYNVGSVMYETSPLEPGQVVGKLCYKHSSESVHLGKYTVHGEKVSYVLHVCTCIYAHVYTPCHSIW